MIVHTPSLLPLLSSVRPFVLVPQSSPCFWDSRWLVTFFSPSFQPVVCLLRYGPSSNTLPSLSLKLVPLSRLSFPFSRSISLYSSLHFSKSLPIAITWEFSQPTSTLSSRIIPKSPGHSTPISSTERLDLRQIREPNTPHYCLSGSLQQTIWSLSQSNVTEFSKLQTSKGSTCPAGNQPSCPGITNCCLPTFRNSGRYF